MIISVPSSSGTRVQLQACRFHRSRKCLFQSPLHRGHAFNGCWGASKLPLMFYFSPLFIGDKRSTENVHVHWQAHNENFSPLFIGDTRSTASVPIPPVA